MQMSDVGKKKSSSGPRISFDASNKSKKLTDFEKKEDDVTCQEEEVRSSTEK